MAVDLRPAGPVLTVAPVCTLHGWTLHGCTEDGRRRAVVAASSRMPRG